MKMKVLLKRGDEKIMGVQHDFESKFAVEDTVKALVNRFRRDHPDQSFFDDVTIHFEKAD